MSKKSKNNFYCVWQGKEPGIYSDWETCKEQVNGVEGAKYKGFSTREEAEKAFSQSADDYIKRSAPGKKKATTPVEQLPSSEQPVFPAWAVDGACSGNPGQMEYQGVEADSKDQIFHYGPVPGGTNNIAEFLAIVHALALLKQKAAADPAHAEYYLRMPIYSDSRTGQAWVRKRKCGTKVEATERNRIVMDAVQRAENWLAVNQYTNPIIKWDTEKWGEIPADFGRK